MVGTRHGWMLAMDNLSHLSDWLSDALCRIATGAGYAVRALYADAEEEVFSAARPILLNGIEDLASRGDLIDRSIICYLPTISDDDRLEEKEFWAAFKKDRPRILGSLYTALATALVNVSNVRLDYLPRMADFAKWIAAAEPALPWEAGTFAAAYEINRTIANAVAMEASVLAKPVETLVKRVSQWEGSATDLLETLGKLVPDNTRHSRAWPKGANALAGKLRRLSANLREAGIEVKFQHSGNRMITLCATMSDDPIVEGQI